MRKEAERERERELRELATFCTYMLAHACTFRQEGHRPDT